MEIAFDVRHAFPGNSVRDDDGWFFCDSLRFIAGFDDFAHVVPVYLDESLRAFEMVYPAGGSLNTSVKVPTERLFDLVAERWVDLCRLPEAPGS